MAFKISPTDRVSIVGKTGSGKSVFAKRVLAEAQELFKNFPFYFPIVIYDQKAHKETFEGFGKRVTDIKSLLRELDKGEHTIYVYTPKPRENNLEGADNFFKEMYLYPNPLLVYVDELSQATDKNKAPEYYENFMKLGREQLKPLWGATQNPVYVPHDFFSNSDHFFIFDLLLESDRKKMAGFAGDMVQERPEDKHGFYYYSVSEREPVYYTNELPPDINNLLKINKKEETEGKETMSQKWVVSMFILGFVLLFVLAVWKKFFDFLGEKVPVTKPVAEFVNE